MYNYFEQSPQTQRDFSRDKKKEEKPFEELVLEHCYNEGCEIIDKDAFVRKSLLDIKKHHEKTFIHSLEVGNVAAFVINRLQDSFTEDEKNTLLMSAFLHDCGKTKIEAEILDKKKAEYGGADREIMKNHPRASYEILKEWDAKVADVVVAHHEHQKDPYPRIKLRFKSKQVEEISRILSIIDSFQSMLDPERPSNDGKPKTINGVIEELNNMENLSARDKKIIAVLEEYYYQKKDRSSFEGLDTSNGLVGNA